MVQIDKYDEFQTVDGTDRYLEHADGRRAYPIVTNGQFAYLDYPPMSALSWDTFQKDPRYLGKPEWVVDGLIPKHQISALVADPKVGKTLLATDLMLCSGLNKQWLGRDVQRLKWFYWDLDNLSHTLMLRAMKRLLAGHGFDGDRPVSADVAALWRLTPYETDMAKPLSVHSEYGKQPVPVYPKHTDEDFIPSVSGVDVLILDSWSRFVASFGDVSSLQATMYADKALREFMRECKIRTAIILHHRRKAGGSGQHAQLGSVGFSAMIRQQLGVVRDRAGKLYIRVENQAVGKRSNTHLQAELQDGYYEDGEWVMCSDDTDTDAMRFVYKGEFDNADESAEEVDLSDEVMTRPPLSDVLFSFLSEQPQQRFCDGFKELAKVLRQAGHSFRDESLRVCIRKGVGKGIFAAEKEGRKSVFSVVNP